MPDACRRLFEHYRAYHEYGPPRLKYMGYVGAISLGLFYFVRFAHPHPQLYDDIVLRVIAVVMFALLALREQWPDKLKPYYIGYSYVALLYCLPCFTLLTALHRGGGVPAISNAFITLCFLVLLTDWRNTLVMLGVGIAMAVGFYAAVAADPQVPMDLVAQLPAFALIVIGGSLFKFSTEQIDAERKLRATQALAGSIAHEMRNPLGQIRHNLESMRQVLPEPGAQAARSLDLRQVDALHRHVSESEMAVKRGLQVIAMTLDEVSAKPVDTSAFTCLSAAEASVKAVQEYAFESDADATRVGVQIEEDFSFAGDETAYLFVLFNLINNALYYVARYPDARVTVIVAAQQVKVRDTGPGIAPEMLPRLFQPFSSVLKSGGTGLGLAYCRRVMHAFGGEIGCESVQGEYTQFNLRFPPMSEHQNQECRTAVLAKARAAFSGKRLLVVDDDSVQRKATAQKLQGLGAAVDEAADGQRALDALASQAYDLVLLDLKMPMPDGYAVADKIRRGELPPNRGVRILAHTSEPLHIARPKMQKVGIEGFVGKPCEQLRLVQAVQQALDRSPAGAGSGPILAGRRVLLADDSPHNRKAVVAYLKHAGAVVAELPDGQAVLDRLERQDEAWDAVLMDITMPGMDGLQTAQAIRASIRPWREIPIVALTAHSDRRTVQAARSVGMNDFLVKPVEASVLYDKLRQLIGATVQAPAIAELQCPTELAGPAGELLNVERLESYRRMGMLHELLADYLLEIARLVEEIDRAVARQDLQAGLGLLHSLLGISGEAGAQALYRCVRQIYVPMVEGHRWPTSAGWVREITVLADRSRNALTEYGALQVPAAVD
jgi:two-component system, CAI-1 autoinducer sensor kinase/phosphatase CqsS